MNKISILKQIDSFLGPVLIPLARRTFLPRGGARPLERVLVIRPGGIGDAVLLIPAIRALKKKYPRAAVHVLAERRNAGVFLLCPDIERIFHYDRPMELMAAIRGRYDAVIDTEQWHRLSALVARVVRAPISLGFSTNERRGLFSHPSPYSHDDYEVDSFLHLVGSLGVDPVFDAEEPFLFVPEQIRTTADRLGGIFSGNQVVALSPGGTIEERRWGRGRFHAVAERLSAAGYGIAVIGGKADVAAGREIVKGIPDGVDLCGTLSLPESAAVIRRSAALIAGDSGVMHLGYAMGTKVVALFGPGIERKWAPRSSRVDVLNKHLPCSPCTKFGYTGRCPIDAECMKRITVEEVVEAAMALLGKA